MNIRILQYNVQKSKDKVMIPVLEGPHEPYDIIAIQEPWPSRVGSTYCPRGCQYNLVFPRQGGARVCLYINKRIPVSSWRVIKNEADYLQVQFELTDGLFTIHNVYSQTPETHRTVEWNTPLPRLLQAIEEPGQHLLVGDFNLHHPLWGGERVRRAHAAAEPLARLALAGRLDLLTDPGTVTRERHGNEPSTLDLGFATPNLAGKVLSHRVVNCFLESDHKLIETIIRQRLP